MAKWADFLISGVKYDSDHSRIEELEIREDLGESVGSPSKQSRATVIGNLRAGRTYSTVLSKDNKWHKGQPIQIVRVGVEEFVRTDRNQEAHDNLGELPEIRT